MASRVRIDVRWVIREAAAEDRSQDRVEVFEVDGGTIVVLADGAGGMAGGEVAASLVVDAFRGASAFDVMGILESLDMRVRAEPRAGETTAVVLATMGDALWGGSAGDSEAWLLHSHHNEEQELTRHQNRKRFGSGRVRVQSFSATSSRETRLLVGSDGLFKYAAYDATRTAARLADLTLAADALLQCVRMPSGGFHDDMSLLLAEWP